MFAFLAGWRLYALAIVGVVFLGLVGAVAYQRQVHKADIANLALAKQNLETVSNALKQSEADKALLARKAQELDSAIQERDSRLKALNETKRKLADELDRLKKSVPKEDQVCLARPLPSGILDLLRDGAVGNKDGTGDSPRLSPPAVPQV